MHARARISDDLIEQRSPASVAARELALANFTHGCELGHGESCHAVLKLDAARLDLAEAACAAHHRWACEMLGR